MASVTLRPQQQAALDWIYSKNQGALFGDLGTGKTLVILSLLNALKKDGLSKTLLIAPKRVKNNVWVPELLKFGCFDLDLSLTFDASSDVHIVNPASMHKVPDWQAYDVLVVDESTDFKNQSQQAKNLQSHAALFRRRYILTAGPIPNGYHDLWGQMFLVDLGLRLERNISTFRGAYCKLSYSGYSYEVLPWAEPIIDRLISDVVFRMDNTGLGVPPRHDIDILVDMPDEVSKVYRSMESKLFAEIEGKKVLAMSASASYTKCKQLTGGFMYDEESNPMHVHKEKLHHLGALHASLGYAPTLVVYQYTPEGKAIAERFNAPRIHGGTSDKKTDRILAEWNRGEHRMLVCQIHTIAMGLNLQFGGNVLVVYSVPDNFNDYFQVVGRLHRPGVKGDVYVYHLVCRGTVDQAKLKPRLGRKESKQRVLLRALNRYKKA